MSTLDSQWTFPCALLAKVNDTETQKYWQSLTNGSLQTKMILLSSDCISGIVNQ